MVGCSATILTVTAATLTASPESGTKFRFSTASIARFLALKKKATSTSHWKREA
jgi:hypothetical protein